MVLVKQKLFRSKVDFCCVLRELNFEKHISRHEKKSIGGKLLFLIKIFNFYQKKQLPSKEPLAELYCERILWVS